MTPEEVREQIQYYDACKRIFNHYGIFAQKFQFIQELAELILAITKNDEQNFVEELADVQVMIDKFTISNADLDKKYRQIQFKKVKRQLKRIEREKKNGRND